MFSRIEFVITETIISLRRHPGMAFAATICVAAALFVAGLAGLAFLNADYAVNSALDRVRFNVFLQKETSRAEARRVYARLIDMPEVESALFIEKEVAWEKLKHDDPTLVRNLSRNPFPDAIEAKAKDVKDIPSIKAKLKTWPEVHVVRHASELSTVLSNARAVVTKYGIIAGGILALLSLVIIHHTIELTLFARRKEIHIMSLVGATPAAVASPFVLEGVVYGLVGGGIALGILLPLYKVAVSSMHTQFDISLLANAPVLNHGMLVILVTGLVLGLLGSVFSIVKYLCRPRSRVTNA